MKQFLRSGFAALMVLVLIVTALLPCYAAGQPSSYSTSSNSGQRDVICTTLDGTSALDYYTGSYTYDNLSELSSSALLTTLRKLMTDTHKKQTSYDNCRDYASKTDCENNNGKITTIYTSYQTTHGEYNGGSGWNREHVWPKSIGGFSTSGGGSDLHHIRPSESKPNSTRSNDKYGEAPNGSTVTGNLSGDVAGKSGTYYEPNDNVKGDVARICLYVYVRWGGTYAKSNNITNVFQSVDVLLEWCELDPVDTWEMGRNEVVEEIQGNRNVFIDYPERAWLLFGREVPDDMTTPSGEAKGNGGSGSGSGTGTTCQHQSTVVKNAVTATCGKSGYTGDTYCSSCNTLISKGRTIAATEDHSWSEWITLAGNTQKRTCGVCSTIETRTVTPTTCPHTNTEVRDAMAPNCSNFGYSGDTYCTDCGKLLSRGTVLPSNDEHTWGDWALDEQYGKERRTCTGGGEKEQRDVEPNTCKHCRSEQKDVKEANCSNTGYSGDTYCADCQKFLTRGTILPSSDEHAWGDWTEESNGTNSRVCTVCGAKEIKFSTTSTADTNGEDNIVTEKFTVLITNVPSSDDKITVTVEGCNATVVGSVSVLVMTALAAILVRKKKDE